MPYSKYDYINKDIEKLTDEEKRLACSCINNNEAEGHPGANPEGLEFFSRSFTIKCVKETLESKALTVHGAALAQCILNKLSN